jgi:GMP synthase-like glutamine amidotransferase
MRVLSVIHQADAASGVFGETVRERGAELAEWNIAAGSPPPAPPESYDAVLVFGGAMHVDQEDRHAWLRDENSLLQALLERGIPILGVCLGAQLIAKAARAKVAADIGGDGPIDVVSLSEGGTSSAGLPSKKPTGSSRKPVLVTGITGQSSGRTGWCAPTTCHSTTSAPSIERSASV